VKWIDKVLDDRARAAARAAPEPDDAAPIPAQARRPDRRGHHALEAALRGRSHRPDRGQAAEISKSAAERAVDAMIGAVQVQACARTNGDAGRFGTFYAASARRAPAAIRAPAKR